MNDREQSDENDLERLFQTLNSPLSDRRFVRDVMRRTNRYARVRRLTLGFSASIGVAISAVPFIQLIRGLAERLAFAGIQWTESMHWIEIQILVAAILCSAALPSVLRWMSR